MMIDENYEWVDLWIGEIIMLYHISKIAGLKILKPQVSTHKKAYVYAIENVVAGLLFGAPHDDFDFIISEENGIPVIMECYPDVFRYLSKAKNALSMRLVMRALCEE